jgi:hypothetical protein
MILTTTRPQTTGAQATGIPIRRVMTGLRADLAESRGEAFPFLFLTCLTSQILITS